MIKLKELTTEAYGEKLWKKTAYVVTYDDETRGVYSTLDKAINALIETAKLSPDTYDDGALFEIHGDTFDGPNHFYYTNQNSPKKVTWREIKRKAGIK